MSARLKLQGRFWRIYTINEFQDLIRRLDGERQPEPRTPVTSANLLGQRIEPLLGSITQQVQHTHPNVGLEGLLKLVFENMDSVAKVTWQGGRGDYGADLIVVFEDRLPYPLQRQHTCVVQAKSYEGKMWDKRAVEDIRRAFDRYPAASMGLIVSTADSTTPEVEEGHLGSSGTVNLGKAAPARPFGRAPGAGIVVDTLAAGLRDGVALQIEALTGR